MSKHQTTLDLDAILDRTAPRAGGELDEEAPLSGHPAAGIQFGPDEIDNDANEIDDDPEKKASSAAKDQPDSHDTNESILGSTEDKKEGESVETHPAEGASESQESESDPQKKKPGRFKDLDSAESSYNELFRLRQKDLDKLKKYEDQDRSQQAQQQKQQQYEQFDQKLTDYSRRRHAQALKDINALDPEQPDYEDQVADIWAQKDVDVTRWQRDNMPVVEKTVSLPDTSQSEDTAASSQTSDSGSQDVDPWAYAYSEAEKAGIDKDDPVFIHWCHQVPAKDENGNVRSLEDRVQQVINETNAYHDKKHQQFLDEQKRKAKQVSEGHQRASQPIGASAAAPKDKGSTSPPKRLSIDDALTKVASERRIGG